MLHLPVVMCRMNFHSKEDSTPITDTFVTNRKSPKVYLGTVVPGIDSLSVQIFTFASSVSMQYITISLLSSLHTCFMLISV